MFEWVQANQDGFFFNLFYDIFKFAIGYLVAQWLYEGVYKSNKYGGWVLELLLTSEEEATEIREITPTWAERILKDDYDLSVYVKGFVSPFFYLNMDVSSDKAKQTGLINIDHKNKKITIDQAKNPVKKK